MRTSSAALPLPPRPRRATRTKATTHINPPSLSKLSQTVRELVEEAQARLQNAPPPHSSKPRREEASKQPGHRHRINSNRCRPSRRSGETRVKEAVKHRPLRRYSLRLRSLRRLVITRSSLQELSKIKPPSKNPWLQLSKRQLQCLLFLRSLKQIRVMIRPLTRCTDHPRRRVWPLRRPRFRTRPHRLPKHRRQQLRWQAIVEAVNAGRTSRSNTRASSSSHKVQSQAPPKK